MYFIHTLKTEQPCSVLDSVINGPYTVEIRYAHVDNITKISAATVVPIDSAISLNIPEKHWPALIEAYSRELAGNSAAEICAYREFIQNGW